MKPGRGRLIAFEGVDGSGKSTQAKILAGSLGAELTFEPGATELGRALRRLVLEPGQPEPDARAEALLVAADRAQHVAEVIRPALAAGREVVTDRFSASTLAYQGYGRGLPVDELRRIVGWASAGIEPDLTILVDVPTSVARDRLAQVTRDRLDALDDSFFARVRQGYLNLAAEDEVKWCVLDGVGAVDTVAAAVSDVVKRRLGLCLADAHRT